MKKGFEKSGWINTGAVVRTAVGQNLHTVASLQLIVECHNLTVDPRANTAVTNLAVHMIGKVNGGTSAWQIHDIAGRGEYKALNAFALRATAHAPGSIGNLGPGLDVLGAAVTGAADSVTAEWCEREGVVILDPGHPEIPSDTRRHSAGLAALEVLRIATDHGVRYPPRGIGLSVKKGLPLSGGQGGSAARTGRCTSGSIRRRRAYGLS